MPSITLGGTEYNVPKLNIGQLEAVSAAFELPAMKRTFAILRIALARATPKIENVNAIEATNDEIANAMAEILQASGFAKAKDPNAVALDQPGTTENRVES